MAGDQSSPWLCQRTRNRPAICGFRAPVAPSEPLRLHGELQNTSWVLEGSLAGVFVRHHLALELVVADDVRGD